MLFRHGQSIANVTHDHDTPDPLLWERGEAEAVAWRRDVAALRAEVVLVSPLRRAVQTACLAFADEAVPLELCRCAKEIFVHEPESTPGSAAELRHMLEQWPRGSELQHVSREMTPHSEDLNPEANIARLLRVLAQREESRIAVVCHGALIDSLVVQRMRHPRNCEVYECEFINGRLKFLEWHFPQPVFDASIAFKWAWLVDGCSELHQKLRLENLRP